MKTKLHNETKLAKEINSSYGLSEREKIVLNLMVNGMTKKAIALSLSLSFHTVDSHIRKIYRKMGVNSKIHAITRAIKENIII